MVPCIPKSNHAALLAACWPSQKALLNSGTFSPDSNALGKLTYYGAHRPHKLPKVAHALLARARSQASQKPGQPRTAQLSVTLGVLKRLIAECAHDLGLFALQALDIIQIGIGCTDAQGQVDLEVAERASSAFHAFTTHAQATSLGPDASFMRKFEETLRKFAGLAQLGAKGGGARFLTARLVGLHAIDGAVTSELFYAGAEHERRSDIAVDAILPSLVEHHGLSLSQVEIEHIVENIDNESDTGTVAVRQQLNRSANERRARSIHATSGDEGKDASNVARAALLTLQAALRTANGGDLTALLSAITRWTTRQQLWTKSVSLPAPVELWPSWLARTVAAWMPLQYRFIAVNAWLEGLDVKQGPSASSRVHAVIAVLTGRASLAGLAVGDVLGRLLPLLSNANPQPASDEVVRAIGALAYRSYYPDQAGDLVQDIAASAGALSHESSSDESGNALVAHAQAIEAVLRAADTETGRAVHTTVPASCGAKTEASSDGPIMLANQAGDRSAVRVEAMQDTLFLLHDPRSAVRSAYERALTHFVRQELPRHASISPASPALGRFLNALAVHAHGLATAQTLCDETSRASSRAPSLAPREGAVAATTDDLDALTEILVGAVASKSSQAVLALAPAAQALGECAALAWPSADDVSRRDGCRRMAATVQAAARATWRAGGGSPLGGLANSTELQQATNLSSSALEEILLTPWTPSDASDRARGGRRTSTTTATRRQTPLYAGTSSGRSIRSTSVADLRATLDGGEAASPVSGAPSISTSLVDGGAFPASALQRRRSGRAASLKSSRSRVEQLEQMGTSPQKGGRLSVYESSPYAVVS